MSAIVSQRSDAAEDLIARAESLSTDFATRAAQHDRDASFPFENFDALGDAGLLNLTIPREFGGEDASLTTVCKVIESMGRGDPSTGLVLSMHFLGHATLARERRWAPEIYERMCSRIGGGDRPARAAEGRAGAGYTSSRRTSPDRSKSLFRWLAAERPQDLRDRQPHRSLLQYVGAH